MFTGLSLLCACLLNDCLQTPEDYMHDQGRDLSQLGLSHTCPASEYFFFEQTNIDFSNTPAPPSALLRLLVTHPWAIRSYRRSIHHRSLSFTRANQYGTTCECGCCTSNQLLS
jgi:hypothetical protein